MTDGVTSFIHTDDGPVPELVPIKKKTPVDGAPPEPTGEEKKPE